MALAGIGFGVLRNAIQVLMALAATMVLVAAAPVAHARETGDSRLARGSVSLGLLGGRELFDQLTGQHTGVGHVIASRADFDLG